MSAKDKKGNGNDMGQQNETVRSFLLIEYWMRSQVHQNEFLLQFRRWIQLHRAGVNINKPVIHFYIPQSIISCVCSIWHSVMNKT